VSECLANAEFQIMNTGTREDFEKKIEGKITLLLEMNKINF